MSISKRKIMSFFMTIILLLSFTGCSDVNTTESTEQPNKETDTNQEINHGQPEDDTAKLVIYYSYTQNTATVAKRIADNTGADLYEIRTVTPYPNDPYETSDISIDERNSGNLPELVDDFPDLSLYEVIFIGSPIWNGYASTPLESYLEQTDFSGKTVVPFCTSNGSGESGYLKDFQNRLRNPKEVAELLHIRFPGNAQPNAFTNGELDDMMREWIAPYVSTLNKDSRILLNSGYQMPVLGLGTWSLSDEEAENCTYEAIKDGYRLFDTARYYGTEAGIGRAVRRAIDEGLVTREEIFITTKIVPSGDSDYAETINECNERIGLDYIDLMLIHQSGAGEKKLYRAMEDAVENGIIKSIGISNYYTPKEFDDITDGAKIMPAVVQNENHIYYQNTEFQQYVSQFGTVVESWYPFGGRGHTGESFGNETIIKIAEAHEKTPAQIILRWHLQAGYIVIPGSSNPEHIAENIDVFGFALTEDEMRQIAELDTNERYESW